MSDVVLNAIIESRKKFIDIESSSTVVPVPRKVEVKEVDKSTPTYICFLSSPDKTRCFLNKYLGYKVNPAYYKDLSILKITMNKNDDIIIELVNNTFINKLSVKERITGDPTSKYIIYIITIKSFNIERLKDPIQSLVFSKDKKNYFCTTRDMSSISIVKQIVTNIQISNIKIIILPCSFNLLGDNCNKKTLKKPDKKNTLDKIVVDWELYDNYNKTKKQKNGTYRVIACDIPTMITQIIEYITNLPKEGGNIYYEKYLKYKYKYLQEKNRLLN